MAITIALAGNPNSGKTTLFNALTGSSQYVGNWPGVTVEKKGGKLKGNKDVEVMDLPGIYSLSPYTQEEVVARNYLIDEQPDVILNIIDGTNLERNLYLTTQLAELGIPMVVAVNMMDIVNKNGDKIDFAKLSSSLGCPVCDISALKQKGIDEATEKAIALAKEKKNMVPQHIFGGPVEHALAHIEEAAIHDMFGSRQRWFAIKIFERDEKILERLKLDASILAHIEKDIQECEAQYDDDAESIITGERYDYISKIISGCYKKKNRGGLSTSDKIDRIVTNRILALPIFIAVMSLVYYLAVSTVGTVVTDWTNDVLFGEWIAPGAETLLNGWGCPEWLVGLVVEGIIGGVGGVLGFVPQMLILFLLLSILEDCGYMARIAFIMDRIFRRFGLSGKSFIPILIGTGCGVPGIMASRTIENPSDRRMTIITTTFIPCGAKLPIISLIAGALFGGAWWIAPCAYFIGIAAIIVSGIILKKLKMFAGEPAPFVMELPAYHAPTAGNIFRSTWERGWSFIKRAGTVILVASMFVWFFASFGFVEGKFTLLNEENIEEINAELLENDVGFMDMSLLATVGGAVDFVFEPLGFGDWQPTVATVLGLMAKEEVVGAMTTMAAIEGDGLEMVESEDFDELSGVSRFFSSKLAAFSFLIFNLLCAPCFAAMGAIRREMNSGKWTAFAIGYQTLFAYVISLCLYQFGTFFTGGGFGIWTAVAVILAAVLIFMFVRPAKKHSPSEKETIAA